MLDVMSGGRLEIAFPLGTGMEYWANSMNPTTPARARFREIDRDHAAGLDPELARTTYDGEFYLYRYLNVWPKPFQKPHPKLAIVGTGSPETIEFAAQRGWAYSQVFTPKTQQIKTFKTLREAMPKYGHEMTPDKALFNAIVYVAETAEQAEREAKEHIKFYFMDALRTTPPFSRASRLCLARAVPHTRLGAQHPWRVRLGRVDPAMARRGRHGRACRGVDQ